MGIFYKIERDGRFSYLLGTVHTLSFDILPKACQKLIKEAKCYIGEASNNTEDSSIPTFKIKGEPVWYEGLPSELKKWLEVNEDSSIKLKELSYAYLSIIFTVGLPFYGMDHSIIDMAQKNSCAFYALDEGFNPHGRTELQDQIYPAIQFAERNYYWLPKILQLHQNENTPAMIFVGLGHLVGKDGLLKLLEESGFKIQQMDRTGNFIDYGNYQPNTTLADRLICQDKAYRLLRDQVLGSAVKCMPLSSCFLSWMKQLKDKTEYEKWQEQYRQKYPYAEKKGYGPGALIPL